MLNGLPRWSIPDLHPAFFDTESATSIEMVAKLYGKVKEVVEYCNKFTVEMTARIDEAYNYMKTNLHNVGKEIINNMIESGEFYVGVTYDETTESLDITFSGGGK